MIQVRKLEPVFIKHIPTEMETGKLYVSMEYATASHLCCCGCGEEVVTPITPTDWTMEFNGEAVSLRPSIGNWNLPCRSHYFIRRGTVVEAASWSREQIDDEWQRDRQRKAAFYKTPEPASYKNPNPASDPGPSTHAEPITPSVWRRLLGWFGLR